MVMMANNSYLKIKRRMISFEVSKESTRSTFSDRLPKVQKIIKKMKKFRKIEGIPVIDAGDDENRLESA